MTEKKLSVYARACGPFLLEALGNLSIPVKRVVHDSRLVCPGDLFVAIAGSGVNARKYLPQAVDAGAVALVYAGDPQPGLSVPSLRVSSDYAALGRLAECARDNPGRHLTAVGVTGTNGKTSSCWLVDAMLRRDQRRTALLGTVVIDLAGERLSAERTTPTPLEFQDLLACARARQVDTLVMEVSSHALAQRRMGTMKFKVAVFTNLTQDHLDYHRNMEQYFAAKKRLFTEQLAADGTAMINSDDPWGRRLAKELRADGIHCVCCGFREKADIRVEQCDLSIEGAVIRINDHERSESVDLQSPLPGRFNVSNLLGAYAAARRLGVSVTCIQETITRFTGVPGRMERISNDQGVHVVVDYAHTPDALRCGLETLRPLCRGRLLVVFGCGGDRDQGKRPLMGRLAAELADQVIVTSDNPRSEDPQAIIRDILAGIPTATALYCEPDRAEAVRLALDLARPGDTIFLAGKGHEQYQEVKGERQPFDDRSLAADLLHRSSSVYTSA